MDNGNQEHHGIASIQDEFEKINPGDPLSISWRDEPLTSTETSKVTQVLQACKDNNREQLIALAATPGGLIEDHVRRLACM